MRLNAILAIVATFTLVAHGDAVSSTFGPGQAYDTSRGGYDVGTVPDLDQVIAVPFTPTETVILTDAVVAVQQLEGNSPMTVYIESSLDGAPGSILDTLILDNASGSWTGTWPTDPNLTFGAFEINGTARSTSVTPEPCSLIMLATELICAAGMVRLRSLSQ